MEKEPDSMATVQMKADYAASDVYSTAGSEAPPAYRQQSSSVKIAKIIALTVIASSFIIGSFILASTYLQAKASCDQMQTLDSVLERELMLEALQQELPNAEALIQSKTTDIHDNDISKDQKDETEKKEPKESPPTENESETDSSFSESEESGETNRVHIKLPLELDLSDLANAILENNQKSRMNCVIERRRAEEFVDAPSKTMQLPFGVNLTTDPKRQRVTGERMAIFCESGVEPRHEQQAEQIPQFMMPPQRYPIPFGPIPQQVPLTHMPQQMQPHIHQQQQLPQFAPPQFMIRQMQMMPPQQQQQQQQQQAPQQMMHHMPPPIHQMPPNLPVPDQIMQAPRPEQPEMRIQLQRIPFPIRGDVSEPVQIREILSGRDMPNMTPQVQVQRIPLSVALQRAGITPDDLRNIQRMAEERIQQELRHLAAEDSNGQSSGDSSDSSDEDEDSQTESEQQPQILQIGRGPFARNLITPVRIPVNMMQHETSEEPAPSDRPHFVQPRSVRSVDSVLKGEKRVKRCACECNC